MDQQVYHADNNLVYYCETARQEREVEIRRCKKEWQALQTQLKEKNVMLSQQSHHLQYEKKAYVNNAVVLKPQCKQLTAAKKSEINVFHDDLFFVWEETERTAQFKQWQIYQGQGTVAQEVLS